jgi:hypothetical protein
MLDVVEWIRLTQDRNRWRAVVNTVTNRRITSAESVDAEERLCCMKLVIYYTI